VVPVVVVVVEVGGGSGSKSNTMGVVVVVVVVVVVIVAPSSPVVFEPFECRKPTWQALANHPYHSVTSTCWVEVLLTTSLVRK